MSQHGSAVDPITRLRKLGSVLARTAPGVLVATAALFESLLEAADQDIATERIPAAPVALTAEQVLEVARARGVPAFAGAVGDRLIFLSSLGFDLTEPGIRAALVEMHRRGELRLARLEDAGAARVDLAARGLRIDLVEWSAIDDGDTTYHVVVVSADAT
jgi:hypothetical protein